MTVVKVTVKNLDELARLIDDQNVSIVAVDTSCAYSYGSDNSSFGGIECEARYEELTIEFGFEVDGDDLCDTLCECSREDVEDSGFDVYPVLTLLNDGSYSLDWQTK